MKALSLIIIFCQCLLLPCYSARRPHLAPGFYTGDSAGSKKLYSILSEADVRIKLSWHSGISVGDRSKMTMVELEALLKKESGRSIATIHLDKNHTDVSLEKKVDKLLVRLGFNEILIVGAHSSGAQLEKHWNRAWQHLPSLFIGNTFNAETLAAAVNHYVDLGEERAVAKMTDLADRYVQAPMGGFDSYERVGWICRILFEGKEGQSLRPPRFGGLALPYHSMPKERWPLFPVAESNGVYFVLAEGYSLRGRAEPLGSYVDYCRKNGVFRKKKIKEPGEPEVQKAFQKLIGSERWDAILWKDTGPGSFYEISEDWVKSRILAQVPSGSEAEFNPKKVE